MACWVVPAIAAEFWGVSLDVVWSRILGEEVSHKSERGFVFVDVDPLGREPDEPAFEPPPTFVSAASTDRLDDYFDDEPVAVNSDLAPIARSDAEDEIDFDEEMGDEEETASAANQLAELDQEESATFGRLSWEDVRQRVSRSRRPPARAIG